MSNRLLRFYVFLMLFAGMVAGLAIMISCGGGSSGSGSFSNPTTGTITTSMSDPPTCAAPNGNYSNVYVTITKVTANINGDASPSDSGWQTLVDLTSNPMQIDLLSLASTTCLLTQLGSTSGLPPGNYQQIRLYLLANDASSGPSNNHCGSGAFNCMVFSNGSVETLQLSSEAQTGIKIPPGQIAGGGINLKAGQSADLNIDFNTCESLVMEGNGQIRLKPTLHAGEVALNQNSIGGTVVVAGNANPPTPVPGAIVFLEQPDPNNSNIDRVVHAGISGSDGTFIFCPLAAGTYDVVVAAMTTGLVPTTYNATVTLAVALGTNMGNIPLVPEPPLSSPATISGLVSATSTSATTGADADIGLSALQSVGGGSSLLVTVPAFSGSTTAVSTTFPLPTSMGATTCGSGSGTGCVSYSLILPASNPQVGTFSASPATTYTAPAAPPVIYWVNAQAFVPSSGSTPGAADCSPSSLPAAFNSGTQLTVTPGGTTTSNIAFSGCQ